MGEWRRVRLGKVLTESKILSANPNPDKRITVRLHVNGVEKRPLAVEKAGATKYFVRRSGQFIYGKQNFQKGAFGVIPPELDGFESSLDLPAFDVREDCLPEWLVYWFRTGQKYEHLSKVARGAGSQRVSVDDFLQFEIALPNVDTQVEILSSLKSIEQIKDEFEREKENQLFLLKQLRQAVLQEAVEGKLTTDWRSQHPVVKGDPQYDAAALLAQIKAEKERLVKVGKIRKEKPLPPIADSDKPFELPAGWVWCRLGETGIFGRGKSKHRPRNDEKLFSDGSYPFVQTGDVSQSKYSKFVISTYTKCYNDFGLRQSQLWEKGTLCITIAANIAETGFLGFDACFPDSVVGFRSFSGEVTPKFIRFFLNQAQENIIKFAPATAQKNINLDIIGSLVFPLSPLAEQQAIVTRVDRLMGMIDELEKQVAERKEQAQMLMQVVLREAFAGGEGAEVDDAFVGAQHAAPIGDMPHRTRARHASSRLGSVAVGNVGADCVRPGRMQCAPMEDLPLVAEIPTAYKTGGQVALPAANQPVPSRILAAMQPGRDYSRADLMGITGISKADWIWAIRQLKEQGRVVQKGERRAARYLRR